MRRLFLAAAAIVLVAATPDQVVPELDANGYYIEPGSAAGEQVVSDAVFEARAAGGRLYLVVLAEEPPGGATTFSDSVRDRLGPGYVVTVAPETVGFSGDGSFWSAEQMNAAVDASLNGGSDDQVVQLFVSALTGGAGGGEAPDESGGLPGWIWLVVIVGGALLLWAWMSNNSRRGAERARAQLEKVKTMARDKLDEIANDIIEMEAEVELSENSEVNAHYQRASATYTEILSRIDQDPGPGEMVEVIGDLDTAIWELDAAEALLDGKPVPEKPVPPEPKPVRPVQPEASAEDDYDYVRRPQRRSSYGGNNMMMALWALMALSGRGRRGWGGFGGRMGGGGFGGMRGGGMRGGGFGGMRGGGRRG